MILSMTGFGRGTAVRNGREITVELTDAAKQYIVDNGYDPVYGARPLKR